MGGESEWWVITMILAHKRWCSMDKYLANGQINVYTKRRNEMTDEHGACDRIGVWGGD